MFVRLLTLALCAGCMAEVEDQTEAQLGSGSGSGSGCTAGSGSASARNELVGASRYGRDVSIALDGGGAPWVSYVDVDWTSTVRGVRVARRTSTGWVNELVDASGAQATSLAGDGAGHVVMSYSNSTGHVRFAQRVQGVWNSEAVTNDYRYGYVFHQALAVDGAGRPHIAFVGRDTLYATHLYHAVRGAAGWTVELVADVADDNAVAVAIAVDSTGAPRFGFYDLGHRQVHYITLASDTIVATLTSADYEDDRQTISLVLDPANRPRMAFRTQTGDILYVASNGTTWSTTTVASDSTGWPALALDCAGTARLAFQGEGLILARQTSTGFSYDPAVTNYGLYAALATDSYGHAHTTYYDLGGQIRYQFSP